MQKTIISLVILVAVVAGGYLVIKNGKRTESVPTVDTEVSSQAQENTSESTAGKKMAFSEFIKQGGSYKCDVKQYMNDFENSGTVYISNGKISGEYSTVAEGMNIKSNFIISDGYSYGWSSALPNMGMKVKIVSNADGKGETYTWSADQVGDYNCEPWTPDESKFNIPTSVTFKTIGA